MNNTMNTRQLRDMFLSVARRVVDSEDFLTEIDLKIGDGDHGFGMALGFKAVKKALEEREFPTVEAVFHGFKSERHAEAMVAVSDFQIDFR